MAWDKKKFLEYKAANPQIAPAFEQATLDAVAAGATKGSGHDLIQQMRWHSTIVLTTTKTTTLPVNSPATSSRKVRLPNDLVAFLTRYVAWLHPTLMDFFEKKPMKHPPVFVAGD